MLLGDGNSRRPARAARPPCDFEGIDCEDRGHGDVHRDVIAIESDDQIHAPRGSSRRGRAPRR
eukprot:12860052-Prorocentrum_lima.AAC.1